MQLEGFISAFSHCWDQYLTRRKFERGKFVWLTVCKDTVLQSGRQDCGGTGEGWLCCICSWEAEQEELRALRCLSPLCPMQDSRPWNGATHVCSESSLLNEWNLETLIQRWSEVCFTSIPNPMSSLLIDSICKPAHEESFLLPLFPCLYQCDTFLPRGEDLGLIFPKSCVILVFKGPHSQSPLSITTDTT